MAEKMRNCRGCGKLFLSRGPIYCPACLEKQAEDEHRIIDYVRKNPDCTIPDIVNALEINEPIVRRLIEEGRLFQAGIDFYYPCVKCGAPISVGQYCDRCAKKLKADILSEQRKRDSRDFGDLRYRQLLGKK